MPRVVGLMRSRMLERLGSLAGGFSPATEASLGLPEDLDCVEAEGALVYGVDCKATAALAADRSSARACGMPRAVYGLCLYDHGSATFLLLHDLRRRIFVRTRLFTIGEHETSPWKRIELAIDRALGARTGASDVGVSEHGVVFTMPAPVVAPSPARRSTADRPCGGPWELLPIHNRIECELRVLAGRWNQTIRRVTVGADPRIERVAAAAQLLDAVAELALREKQDLRAVRRARIVLVESIDVDFWNADIGTLGRLHADICERLRAVAAIDMVDHERAISEYEPRIRRRIEAIQDLEAARMGQSMDAER